MSKADRKQLEEAHQTRSTELQATIQQLEDHVATAKARLEEAEGKVATVESTIKEERHSHNEASIQMQEQMEAARREASIQSEQVQDKLEEQRKHCSNLEKQCVPPTLAATPAPLCGNCACWRRIEDLSAKKATLEEQQREMQVLQEDWKLKTERLKTKDEESTKNQRELQARGREVGAGGAGRAMK